jgi:hypothetical protein
MSYTAAMPLRRALTLVLLLYLTMDYCDPSVPGVFFFDSEALFMESVQAKTPVSIAAPPRLASPLPARETLEKTIQSTTLARTPVVRTPYFPRTYRSGSPPRSPVDSAEDH